VTPDIDSGMDIYLAEGVVGGIMEGPSDGQIILGPGDTYINSSTAPVDTTSNSSPHVAKLQKLLYRRMLIGVNDGRYFLGLFHCIDKQGNIILQDAVEYRSARHSVSSPMEQRFLGLILIPASCRSSCHVDCFIEEQMSLLSLDK
jgi:small nuclear ribonucleoprotein (snRNP)-like protein